MKSQSRAADENQLRRLARCLGYSIRKSRRRTVHANDLGGYMLVSDQINGCVLGERYDASLEDIRQYLNG